MTGKGEKEALTARQRGGYTREGKSGAQSIPEIIVAEAAADSSEEEGIKKLPCGRENDERGRLPVNGWHHRQASPQYKGQVDEHEQEAHVVSILQIPTKRGRDESQGVHDAKESEPVVTRLMILFCARGHTVSAIAGAPARPAFQLIPHGGQVISA